jgi:hypothetical protein
MLEGGGTNNEACRDTSGGAPSEFAAHETFVLTGLEGAEMKDFVLISSAGNDNSQTVSTIRVTDEGSFRTSGLYSFDSIRVMWQCHAMEWDVLYDETFVTELAEVERQSGSSAVREEIAALALLLRRFGPSLRRPHCDTLKGSKHANMKELRFTLPDGEWRVAFAFDPRRSAILLVAGNKSGTNERRFYRQLIRTADRRFDAHLQILQ